MKIKKSLYDQSKLSLELNQGKMFFNKNIFP